jgi:repressor LexA
MGGTAAQHNRIRDLRLERKLTQEELAALLGEETSIATVSRLESGRMTLTQPWMERIATALGVSPHDIIARQGSGLRMVPLIGQIAAGDWALAVREPMG